MSQGPSRSNELGRNPRRITAWAIFPLLLLLVPFIAMQFTAEVQWGVADFVFAGILLAARHIRLNHLIGLCLVLGCGFNALSQYYNMRLKGRAV